ncbi:MAG TPA: EH signature domain-containing protein [Syntrophorhabdaceae bacterium]|nr:EH signature domain-containing protein [Syntrophorhabdaceae bacterium]
MIDPRKKTSVSFEELDAMIHDILMTLDASAHGLTREAPCDRLQNLQSAAYGIDSPVVYRKMPFDRHRQDWVEFSEGGTDKLDLPTIKYLCWVPEIALDERFLHYVAQSSVELKWRSLAGLVRSCHSAWGTLFSHSNSLLAVRELLKSYHGSHHVILTWQKNPDAVLSRNGPLLLADMLIRTGSRLRSFADEWGLEKESTFFQEFVKTAAEKCRQRMHRLPDDVLLMLFRDLLSWKGWKKEEFKKEIGGLILHQPMNPHIQEVVQRFILHHKELGDPRLTANGSKWSGVPVSARNVFTEWLRREVPFAFSERVFQEGRGWTWQNRASRLEPLHLDRQEWH